MLDDFIALVEQVRANPDPAQAIVVMVKGIADKMFRVKQSEEVWRLAFYLDEHARSLAEAVFATTATPVGRPEEPKPLPKTQTKAKTGQKPATSKK